MDDWLLQEYLERCKPLDQGVGLPEADARWFFQQLILGLDFCHRLGIAHQVRELLDLCCGPLGVLMSQDASTGLLSQDASTELLYRRQHALGLAT